MAHVIAEKDMHPNFGKVPASKGVPFSVLLVTVIGILAIFATAAGVVLNSSYGHQWPANNTERTDLGKPDLG